MKKSAVISFALILLSYSYLPAVNPRKFNRDSLRAIANNKSLPDSIRLFNACYFILTYDYVMPDSMLYYAGKYHEESVKANYLYGIAYTEVIKGWWYTMKGENKEAMKRYLSAMETAEKSGQPLLLGFVYGEVGSGYSALMMLDKAAEYLLRSIKIYRDLKEYQREISRMNNLAHVYQNSGNTQKATEILFQVIANADTMKTGSNIKASALHSLGNIYKESGRKEEAVKFYTEALNLHRYNKNYFFERITLSTLADVFLSDKSNRYGKVVGDDRQSLDIALSYLQELEQLSKSSNDLAKLSQAYLGEGIIYVKKGDRKKALEKVAEAQKLDLSRAGLETQLNVTNLFAKLYSKLGDHKRAEEKLVQLMALKDSADMVKMTEKVSLLTESFEIEQMEDQLSRKEEQLRNNRLITYLFIAVSALILVLALITFYFLRQKQKAAKLLERQKKEIEEQRNRAEQSEKFKERFLASMSHEIRTPLNAVIGMTGLLLDEKHPPKTENYLKNIKQAGEHLTEIINDILDLSKMEAGKLELQEAPFNLWHLLEEMRNLFGVRAKEKDLQLIVLETNDTPEWVSGDNMRLRQVLLNLVGNAIKFTERGSVKLEVVRDITNEEKFLITFRVEDTGPGIALEDQAAIFHEFVQAGHKSDQKGTGLGLSISMKLVERMGGKLEVESESGKGSLFRFTIPLKLSSKEAFEELQAEKRKAAETMKGHYRILVVEDNLSNQIVTEGILEKILPESEVTMASDGYVALHLLSKHRFDLVLMDIRMPGIDGYEVTRRIRELTSENAEVPVVALTASVIRADIQRCLDAGMNGYVPKPVSRESLAKALREQLKINGPDSFLPETGSEQTFLNELPDKPSWAETLAGICNGRKDRFLKYLGLFISETSKELDKWQDLAENGQFERIRMSLHKIKPYLKIFSGDQSWNMAAELEEQLKQGWDQQFLVKLNELHTSVKKAQQESQELSDRLVS